MGNIASSSNSISSNDESNLNQCIVNLDSLVKSKLQNIINKRDIKDIETIKRDIDITRLSDYYNKLNNFKKYLDDYQKNPQNSQNPLFNILKHKQQNMNNETMQALERYNLLIRLLIKKRLIYRYSILYLTIKILSLNAILKSNLNILDKTIGTILSTHTFRENQKDVYDKIMKIITNLDKNKFTDTSETIKTDKEVEDITRLYNENLNKIKQVSVKVLTSADVKPLDMIGGDNSNNNQIQIPEIQNFMKGFETDYTTFKQYDRRAKFYIQNVTEIIKAYSNIYITILQKKKNENDGIDMDELVKKFADVNLFLDKFLPTSAINPTVQPSFKQLLLNTVGIIKNYNEEFIKEFEPIRKKLENKVEDQV
jgi:hypothetical protein